MKKITDLFILIFFVQSTTVFGQVNFRQTLKKNDPVDKEAKLNFEEKLTIHQSFLDQAIQNKNQLKQLQGLLYIFFDYLKIEDFTEAARYILEAENFAKESGNIGWKGWVKYGAGALYVRINQEEKAIETYTKAVEFCGEAGDSLCLGESLEQLSAMNGLLGNHERAGHYFNLAMPLLEKFGSKKQLGTALNNFGSLMSMKGKPAEAIPFMEEAIKINLEAEQLRSAAKGMNNLADAYRRLEKFDVAIEKYNECLKFNTEHHFLENKITNLMGLYLCYEGKGKFEVANEFLVKRFSLKDSLTGVKMQEKIAELEAKYENERKELALQKNQIKLMEAQRSVENRTAIIIFLLLLASAGLWQWKAQTQRTKLKLEENQTNLTGLTRLLLEKNTLLTNLEKQITASKKQNNVSTKEDDFSDNLYNQRILTKEDWAAFKIYFEKTYPKYLMKLRKAFPSLSEAEERLFLFIKLNLTSKEAAAILGISIESVKKTRHRLRKRLELEQEVSLEGFIQDF